MPLLREEAERMADILEAVLARLSWPQDANHIINIRSTLETIKSSLFTTLVDIQSQNTGETCDVAGVVEDSRVEMHPQLASNPQQDLAMDHIKETSIDHGVVDNAYLHPAVLNSPPVHDCVVLGNQVAIEMQEPLTTGHYKHNEQNETTFVTNGNSTESDGCNSIITNKHCEPDYKPPSPNYEQHQPDYKPPYPNYEQCQPDYKPPSTTYEQCQPDYKPPSPSLRPGSNKPDEPEYKPPAGQRDILFPMRDQKSLLEIKQTLQRRADSKDQEA